MKRAWTIVGLTLGLALTACGSMAAHPSDDAGLDVVHPNADSGSDGTLGTDGNRAEVSLAQDAIMDAAAIVDAPVADATPCVVCPNGCFDIDSDPNNCGSCGFACPTGHNGAAVCTHGTCSYRCDPGLTNCGNNNNCLDLTSLEHCGSCTAQPCTLTGGTPLCFAGQCGGLCSAGEFRCGNYCADLSSSPQNCGDCGHACPAPNPATHANAVSLCIEGACQLDCSSWNSTHGQLATDCDFNPLDGCEVDLLVSASNCGTCGHACGGSHPCCRAGACVGAYANCPG